MKCTTHIRRISRRLATTFFAVLLLGPGVARAAECPESSPEDAQERRRLAKEWFATAEAAETGGNDTEAVRAYACSYKMVAHPFTAYNLGRVSERAGDNELATKMYKAYLTLKPDAQDKDELRAKIKVMEDKMAAAKEGGTTTEAVAPGEEGADNATEPPAVVPPPPPPEKPARVVQKPADSDSEGHSHTVEWVVGGASAVALVAGVALNLAARSKMSACQADASKGAFKTANGECDAARPLAYTSYGLFGAAAVGVAVDALLVVLHSSGDSGSSSEDDSSVGFLLLPGGGGGLTARGRF